MTRPARLTWCLLVAVAVACSGCGLFDETPEYKASRAVIDSCGASDHQLTDDLAADLIGGWKQSRGGAHPLTGLAYGDQILIFEPDGTGEIWWAYRTEADTEGGRVTFEWTVEDGHLIVNDLPPAEVIQGGPGDVRVRPAGEDDLNNATGWRRCGETLEAPQVHQTSAVVML